MSARDQSDMKDEVLRMFGVTVGSIWAARSGTLGNLQWIVVTCFERNLVHASKCLRDGTPDYSGAVLGEIISPRLLYKYYKKLV